MDSENLPFQETSTIMNENLNGLNVAEKSPRRTHSITSGRTTTWSGSPLKNRIIRKDATSPRNMRKDATFPFEKMVQHPTARPTAPDQDDLDKSTSQKKLSMDFLIKKKTSPRNSTHLSSSAFVFEASSTSPRPSAYLLPKVGAKSHRGQGISRSGQGISRSHGVPYKNTGSQSFGSSDNRSPRSRPLTPRSRPLSPRYTSATAHSVWNGNSISFAEKVYGQKMHAGDLGIMKHVSTANHVTNHATSLHGPSEKSMQSQYQNQSAQFSTQNSTNFNATHVKETKETFDTFENCATVNELISKLAASTHMDNTAKENALKEWMVNNFRISEKGKKGENSQKNPQLSQSASNPLSNPLQTNIQIHNFKQNVLARKIEQTVQKPLTSEMSDASTRCSSSASSSLNPFSTLNPQFFFDPSKFSIFKFPGSSGGNDANNVSRVPNIAASMSSGAGIDGESNVSKSTNTNVDNLMQNTHQNPQSVQTTNLKESDDQDIEDTEEDYSKENEESIDVATHVMKYLSNARKNLIKEEKEEQQFVQAQPPQSGCKVFYVLCDYLRSTYL